MSNTITMAQPRLRELFLQEEFRGDRLINNIRFYLLFILLALALVKANLFGGLVVSRSLILTLVLIGSGYVYTGALFVLYRSGVYHPSFKFASVTMDITLAVLSIFSYKLDPYPEYAQIYTLARYSIIFWFILWSLVRYNVWLSLYSGLVAGVEYLVLVVINNAMNGRAFTFVAPDGVSYVSGFSNSEAILRVVYLVLAGGLAAAVAQRLRSLVINAISQEQAKNELNTRNRVVEAVNQENRKYLDGITQGLLLVDSTHAIGEHYSAFLTHLFPLEKIAGANLVDFLFPDPKEQAIERRDLEKYLHILFTNKTVDADTLREVNPIAERTFLVRGEEGAFRDLVLAITFHRISGDSGVEDVMVIFEDRTDVVAAQQDLVEERRRHESEVETIAVVLRTGPQALHEFTDESRTVLMEAQDTVHRLEDPEVLNHSFRQLHGLNGSAASLGFAGIAALAHAAEEVLADVRDRGIAPDDEVKHELETRIKEVFTAFDTIQRLTKSFLEFSQAEPREKTAGSRAQFEELLDSLRSMAAELGESLDKKVHLVADNALHEAPFLSRLKNPLIHLVRNAVDHGLEDIYERLSKGKSDTGTITLRAFMKEHSYVVEVADDGRGLDFSAIRARAQERGLVDAEAETVSEAQLLRALFAPGFSTRDVSTEVSGRGVGLDIVRDAVRELGGKISVATVTDKGTRFTVTIPARGR